MSNETNLLRASAKRFGAPVLASALALSTGAFVLGHRHVNAATTPENPIAPINNASIDPLLALDQATEAVASRVTRTAGHGFQLPSRYLSSDPIAAYSVTR